MTLKLYVIDSHEQALDIWRKQQLTNAKLLHIDFHCDQRGLLVNRKKNLRGTTTVKTDAKTMATLKGSQLIMVLK